jgi:cell division protease FtsH
MSKQSKPPPPGDKPTPTAPPPPPGWRHWLWPLALIAALVLFLFLPRFGGVTSVNLTYSAFISDVNEHQVKTFTLDTSTGSTAPATGTLKDGKNYTTVIPRSRHAAGDHPAERGRGDRRPRRAAGWAPAVYWIIPLAPFLLVFWVIRRISRNGAAAGPLGRIMGVGRARAKVSIPSARRRFSDVAAMNRRNARSVRSSTLKHPERYHALGAVTPAAC